MRNRRCQAASASVLELQAHPSFWWLFAFTHAFPQPAFPAPSPHPMRSDSGHCFAQLASGNPLGPRRVGTQTSSEASFPGLPIVFSSQVSPRGKDLFTLHCSSLTREHCDPPRAAQRAKAELALLTVLKADRWQKLPAPFQASLKNLAA